MNHITQTESDIPDPSDPQLTVANNMVLRFAGERFAGEHDAMMYKDCCEYISVRMRLCTEMLNRELSKLENENYGKSPKDSG